MLIFIICKPPNCNYKVYYSFYLIDFTISFINIIKYNSNTYYIKNLNKI